MIFTERVYEDHEMLVDNLMLWTRESKNKILFAERSDKMSLFQTPEKFLLSEDDRGIYDTSFFYLTKCCLSKFGFKKDIVF